MRRIVTALAPALLVVLLGACADGAGEPGGTQDPTPSPTATPTSPPPTSPAPPSPGPSGPGPIRPVPPKPTVSPPPGRDVQTLTGQVVEGVEMNCHLLRTDSTDYLLIWPDGQPRTGTTVTVRGYPAPDLATICMQGTPFVVTEVVDD